MNIKITFLFLFSRFFFYSFPPLPYLFHPFYHTFVFIQYFSPFLSLPLSPDSTLYASPSIQYPFLLSSFSHLNFVIIFLFTPKFPLGYPSHTSCCIWILRFFPFFLACPCLCPFYSALHSSIFLLLLIFSHFFTRKPVFLIVFLSLSSKVFFSFLSSIPLVSCTLPFHPFCLQILPLS
jgi:hypothetical protein